MHARNGSWRRWGAVAGAAGLVLGVLGPVIAHDPHAAPSGDAGDPMAPRRPGPVTVKAIGLETAEVDLGTVEEIVRLTGIVRAAPERVQVLTSAVAGTLAQVHVRLGQRVRVGDPLAEVQSPELARLVAEMHKAGIDEQHAAAEIVTTRSNMEQLRSQVRAAEEQARLAEEESARLQAAGGVAENVVGARRAAAIQARSQVETLRLSLEQSGRTLESLERVRESTARSIAAMRDLVELVHRHPGGGVDGEEHRRSEAGLGGVFVLQAHIDGVVTRLDAVRGQGVEAGKPVMSVVDDRGMLIEGELPESLIARLSRSGGRPVRVWRPGLGADAGLLAEGVVRGISPTVDPLKRTAHLLIDVANPTAEDGGGALRDGQFVSLSVVLRGGRDAVVVPVGAIVTEGPETWVYVKEGEEYHRHDVVAGARDDRVVEILEGVAPGDVVVVRGAYQLSQMRARGGAGAGDDQDGHGHSH